MMTPEEKAWTLSVHKQAMEIVGICGLLQLRAPEGSPEAARGKRAGLAALALATEALDRINADSTAEELQQIKASDYSLSDLAASPVSSIEE